MPWVDSARPSSRPPRVCPTPSNVSPSRGPTKPSRRTRPRIVARFDDAVDQAFDHLRGNPIADRVFYAATELGDFGLVWMLIGATQGLRGDRQLARGGRLAATLAVESVLVNGVIKSFFKRERPVSQEPRPYKMRMPRTTSFPSGHSSTAVVAAMMLSEGNSWWPAVRRRGRPGGLQPRLRAHPSRQRRGGWTGDRSGDRHCGPGRLAAPGHLDPEGMTARRHVLTGVWL